MQDLKLKATNPNEIKFTLNVTMTLAEWRRLMLDIPASNISPNYEFRMAIQEAVLKAESEFQGGANLEYLKRYLNV